MYTTRLYIRYAAAQERWLPNCGAPGKGKQLGTSRHYVVDSQT